MSSDGYMPTLLDDLPSSNHRDRPRPVAPVLDMPGGFQTPWDHDDLPLVPVVRGAFTYPPEPEPMPVPQGTPFRNDQWSIAPSPYSRPQHIVMPKPQYNREQLAARPPDWRRDYHPPGRLSLSSTLLRLKGGGMHFFAIH